MSGHVMWALGTVLTVGALGGSAAWSVDDARKSVLGWGEGVVDRPIHAEPHDPVLHRRLTFDLNEITVSSPNAMSEGLARHAEWWRASSRATVTLGQPYIDGVRAIWLNFQTPTGNPGAISNAAHPVECADPSALRACYHAGINANGTEVHLLLILERDHADVTLHADALLLFNGDTLFQTEGGPLSRLNGETIHTAMAALAMASGNSETFVAPGEVQRWAVEGHASGTLNLAATLEYAYELRRIVTDTDVERLGTGRVWRDYRPVSRRTRRSFVDKWRGWNAPRIESPGPHRIGDPVSPH